MIVENIGQVLSLAGGLGAGATAGVLATLGWIARRGGEYQEGYQQGFDDGLRASTREAIRDLDTAERVAYRAGQLDGWDERAKAGPDAPKLPPRRTYRVHGGRGGGA